MALLKIVQIGDEILRLKAKEVTEFGEKLSTLLEDMYDTMKEANGVGLAAPQIGILKRICIVDVDGERYELINPVIIKASGFQCGVEGCLSVPGRSGLVERPKRVTVKAFDRKGKEFIIKASDYLAVALCHEIDHLDGIMYIDKVIKEEK